MSKKLIGYKGKALDALLKAKIKIGDHIKITKNGANYEGILMPRSELGDNNNLVIKIKSGYNIGIKLAPKTKIKREGTIAKPFFKAPLLPKQKRDLPKVTIISTGGTIASRVDYRTGAVRPVISASDLYSIVPELSEVSFIDTEILFSLHSEDLTSKHWTNIAKTVAKHISSGTQGVVLTHGTDTMGYTAAALSFALQNLPVPVILVGAQRSEDRPSSDAATNLIGAVIAATKAPFAEVAVAMHETTSDESILLHRGTKVRKIHTSCRNAFRTINGNPLARVKNKEVIMLSTDFQFRNLEKEIIIKPYFEEKVGLIKFYPGINPRIIGWYIDQGYKGLVFEGTGLGHIRQELYQFVKEAIDNNIIIAMSSQCIWGRVNMNVYNNGRDLLSMGVIPMEDMLAETALVKLMWALGQTKKDERIRKILMTRISYETSSRTIETSLFP
jgi:glutamyl-tRNA(Gln) amidotransferase subunit D